MSDASSVESAPERPDRPSSWIAEFVTRRAVTLSVLLAITTILARGARWHWALDLFSHFPLQTAVGALGLGVVLLGLRRPKAALLPGAVLAVNVALLLPVYWPARQPTWSGPVIRAVSANVLRSNRRHEDVIRYVRSVDPDVFLAMEVDTEWLAAMEPLHEAYPYRIEQPGSGAFGIALFSRVPIEEGEVVVSAVSGAPMIRATLVFGERRLSFLGVHPLPPVKSGTAELRNGQLREIAALARSVPAPCVLMGDLNITPWSPYFRDLLNDTGLRDARQGFGIQPSWPEFSGVVKFLQIPIDHTLVSEDVEVVGRRLGPNVGSDHLPVELEFRIGE